MNDIKVLHLTNGGFTVLDNEDFERFKRFKWQRHSAGYVCRCQSLGNRDDHASIYLHREILNAPPNLQIDHINGYRHDNTRRNLRLADQSQNNGNMKMQERPKSSQFKGVSLRSDTGKWAAYIKRDRRKITLGCFATEQEAAAAYNEATLKQWGEYARPNQL
jgi:hypothetical protein